MTSQNPTSLRETLATGIGTASLAGGGGFISSMAGLPAGATAALCGLPLVVATVVANRRLGMVSISVYSVCCAVALVPDLYGTGLLACSAFVISSIFATLALAIARRRRHERTVVGLERLNHQILGDHARKPESFLEASKPKSNDVHLKSDPVLTQLHEAGRRIATHSDLDTLIPIIITEARSLFRCSHVEVCFWNHQSRHLSRPFPERARDVGRYEPDPSTGATAWVLATQQLFLADAADRNADLAALTAGDARRPAALVPLIAGNGMLGILVVDDRASDANLSSMVLWNFANLCALGLRNAQLADHVADAARRDPLTGLLDDNGFSTAVEKSLSRLSSHQDNTILSADLDSFSSHIARHGYGAANSVLVDVARLIKAALPEETIVGRVEGDGFMAFLPGYDASSAEQLAEELRETIANHSFGHEGESFHLTCRFGVAAFKRQMFAIDVAQQAATSAMNRAKAGGGNRVCGTVLESANQS